MASVTNRFELSDVPAAFAEIDVLAQQYGYRACLFGSTLRAGSGRDLDVAMVSLFGCMPEFEGKYRGFLAAFGGEIVRRFDNPERFNHSYEVARGGRLFHFIFGRF